ncbi:MAG: MspA family porin [Gordonia sp. (in: high G+C Gram-positive bacteria)]
MKKMKTRVFAAASVVGAVVVGLSGTGAGAASAERLPDATLTKKLVDGTPVTVNLFDQNIRVKRAITNVQTSREVWASGKVKVHVGGEAKGAAVKAGYLIGCQLTFTASSSGAAEQDGEFDTTTGLTADDPSSSGSGTVSIGPGSETLYWVIDNTTSGTDTAYESYNVHKYVFKGSDGGVAFSQAQFGVDGCAGYAQGKPVVKVYLATETVSAALTLYGKPFSLG